MAVINTDSGISYISNGTGTWQGWNHQVYVTSSTTTNTVWQNWNQQYWIPVGTTSTTVMYTPVSEENEQQRAERIERDRLVAADWERRRQEQEEVGRHANELLLALLSDEQAATWREHHWFTVRGSASGDVYRIRRGTLNNVDRMDDGEVETIFCAHPPEVPAEDANLAQMFLLVTDEDAFLRVANSHTPRIRSGRRQREVDAVTVHERHLQVVA